MNRSDAISSVLRLKGREVFSVLPDTSVLDALAIMSEKGVGALLIMQDSRLTGVLSERDYARKVILQGRSSKGTAVREIMSEEVITVTPGNTVDECMMLMTRHRVRHLPVVDRDGLVLGIVSMGDLVKHVISTQQEEIQHLQAYIAGSYMS